MYFLIVNYQIVLEDKDLLQSDVYETLFYYRSVFIIIFNEYDFIALSATKYSKIV